MRSQALQALTCSVVLLAGSEAAWAQDSAPPTSLASVGVLDPKLAAPQTQPGDTLDSSSNSQSPGNSQNTVPAAEHTGLATLARDTYHDFKAFPRRKSTWVIVGVGGGLAALAHPFDQDVNARLVSNSTADKFWKPGHVIGGPVMWGVPVALYVGGRYLLPMVSDDQTKTNKWSHLGLDLIRADILEEGIVQGIKVSVRRTRPNGANYSFPSGHAAATFALAAVLERHLGYRLSWPALAIATYVGTSRLHDNVHYLSDVIFGAAVGTAAGWTVVGRHGRTNYSFEPAAVPGGVAFVITRRPATSN